MKMDIEVKTVDGRAELILKGEFGPDDLANFNKAVNDSVLSGHKQLLIDLKKVDRLGLHGLAALSLWAKEMSRRDGLIVLANVGPEVKRTLMESKLISLFKIYGSKKRRKARARADTEE